MAVYIRGIRLKPELKHSDRWVDVYDVEFSDEQHLAFDDIYLAESRCREANQMSVHVGPHYCVFDLFEYEQGKFALRCGSHPTLSASGASA